MWPSPEPFYRENHPPCVEYGLHRELSARPIRCPRRARRGFATRAEDGGVGADPEGQLEGFLALARESITNLLLTRAGASTAVKIRRLGVDPNCQRQGKGFERPAFPRIHRAKHADYRGSIIGL
jgi:hypothetical protein